MSKLIFESESRSIESNSDMFFIVAKINCGENCSICKKESCGGRLESIIDLSSKLPDTIAFRDEISKIIKKLDAHIVECIKKEKNNALEKRDLCKVMQVALLERVFKGVLND